MTKHNTLKNVDLLSVLKINPVLGRMIVSLNSEIMRGNGGLNSNDKELIAAFVSGLNKCQHCFGVHSEAAKAFGFPDGLLEQALNDIDSADLCKKLKTLLRYAKKLTLEPSNITHEDISEVLASGYSIDEFHDATLTVCLFGFMNRLLEAYQVKGSKAMFEAEGALLFSNGYSPLLNLIS